MIFNMSIGFICIALSIIYLTPVSIFIILAFIYFILNGALNEI